VLTGVCGTDLFRLMPVFLKQAKAMGFALGVEMIRLARECNLLTSPYCFDPESARAMAAAGADVLVPHVGLTTKGSIGATTAVSLDEAPALVQAMHDAAKDVNPDIIVLCHGGPIAEPADAQYMLAHTNGVVGFYGASSMEQLPTEVAISENTRRFKELSPNGSR
jgi:predicted TIM-barrel enzyme